MVSFLPTLEAQMLTFKPQYLRNPPGSENATYATYTHTYTHCEGSETCAIAPLKTLHTYPGTSQDQQICKKYLFAVS